MEDARKIEIDRQRAEIFDALGHPTRILILKVLSEGSFGFADLKKKVGIESSGHLQHHLIKLNGLIKTDEYGKYCLTDEGKDALLTVQTVENTSSKYKATQKNTYFKKPSFRGRTSLKQIAILLMALLFISSVTIFYEFNQIANLESKNTFYENLNPWATEYYNQFGKVPLITFTNSSFTPPISMYQALVIGLEADDWNKTSLEGFTIYCNLVPWETKTNDTGLLAEGLPPFNDNQVAKVLTSPPTTYSTIYSNGTIYSYAWHIDIFKSKPTGLGVNKPWALIVVDASTAQILTHWKI